MIKLGVNKEEMIRTAIKKYGKTMKAVEWLYNNDIYITIEELKEYEL